MYTNEPSGVNQQNDLNASNYQNPVGYQQMPSYFGNYRILGICSHGYA